MSNWHVPDLLLERVKPGESKCYRVFHHRDRPCEPCHVREVFATGQPQKVEKINDLDSRPLEFSAFPILEHPASYPGGGARAGYQRKVIFWMSIGVRRN